MMKKKGKIVLNAEDCLLDFVCVFSYDGCMNVDGLSLLLSLIGYSRLVDR